MSWGQIPFELIPKFKNRIDLDHNYNKVKRNNGLNLNGYTLYGNKREFAVAVWDSIYDPISFYSERISQIDFYWVRIFNEACYYYRLNHEKQGLFAVPDSEINAILQTRVYPSQMIDNREIGLMRLTFFYDTLKKEILCEQAATNELLLNENQELINKLRAVAKINIQFNNKPYPTYFDYVIHFEFDNNAQVQLTYNKIFVPFTVPKWTEEEMKVLAKFDLSFVPVTGDRYDGRIEDGEKVMTYMRETHGVGWQQALDSCMLQVGKNWQRFQRRSEDKKVETKSGFSIYPNFDLVSNFRYKKRHEPIYLTFHKNGVLKSYKSNRKVGQIDGFLEVIIDKEYDATGKLIKDNGSETFRSVM